MDNENELYSSDVESDDDFMKIPENIDSLPFDTNGNPVNKDDDMIPLSLVVGDYLPVFTFGQYKMQTTTRNSNLCIWNKLKWYLIDCDGDYALLIADKCIAADYYYGKNNIFEPAKPCTWEDSNVREFLNGEFYEHAFSEEEKSLIIPHNKYGDKLYILDQEKLEKLFPYDELRKGEIYIADDFHKRIEVWLESTCWWVNTVGQEENNMVVVSYNGDINTYGCETSSDEIGIRPVIWVNLLEILKLNKLEKEMIYAKRKDESYGRPV